MLESNRRPLVPAALALVLAMGAAAHPLQAQEGDPLAEAHALREGGQLVAAAEQVRLHLAASPDDAGARWLLAQLLAALGERSAAHAEYEHALRFRPHDGWLRIDYANALIAAREFGRARQVLVPAAERPGAPAGEVAEAEALLGTLEYWRGDLAQAVARFERSLTLQPDHGEAARQLREIREWSRPWIETQVELTDDNQPYTRFGGTFRGGVFLYPLWSASVRIAPGTLEAGESATTVEGTAELRGYLPAARLEVSAGGGFVRDSRGGSDPIGSLSLALRLPGESALRLSSARERYLGTAASVDTLLLYDRIELRFDRSAAPGWAGEVVARAEQFPDGNVIRTAYAWALAPLLLFLRAGYAAAWQDAEFSTWQPGPGSPRPGVPQDPGPARYDPYYTPRSGRVHTALAELLTRVGSASLRLSGAVGVHARELAPELVTGPAQGQAELQFAERSFTPWRLTATLDLPVNPSWSLRIVGEREATAFYEVVRLTAGSTYRLGAGR